MTGVLQPIENPLSPFWQGESASDLNDNKYAPGTAEHMEWMQGWEHGRVSREAW
jgi:hypothetical protein